jgi:hypothetical protein
MNIEINFIYIPSQLSNFLTPHPPYLYESSYLIIFPGSIMFKSSSLILSRSFSVLEEANQSIVQYIISAANQNIVQYLISAFCSAASQSMVHYMISEANQSIVQFMISAANQSLVL